MKTAAAALLLFTATAIAAETPDLTMQTRIRQEEFRNSKVMEIGSGLIDFVGARLTGSPNMKRANEWTRDKLTEFGLSNAHLEPWGPFGKGWSYEYVSLRMTSPDVVQLSALPRAWTPSTNGIVRGVPVKVKIETKEDLDKNKGKLAGKFVLLGDAPEMKPHEKAQFTRYDDKALTDLGQYEIPRRPQLTREEAIKRRAFFKALLPFLAEEKPLAVIVPGGADYGNYHVQGAGTYRDAEQYPVPSVVLSDEQYGRLARLLDSGKTPELELEVRAHTVDSAETFNTVAELPGTDKKNEIVMLGAHLDSWHGGTGATDNGAGSIVVMEVMRVLKAIGVAPRRTIRVALWSGEEEGLLGSRAYVSEHFGSRPEPPEEERNLPSALRRNIGPLTLKPEHAKLAGYFNLDNGTGKIRGVYAQENAAVVPIFQTWLESLKDLGATTVTMRNTSGTDHLSFDAVGLPGFQFIQDPLDYSERTHHTNYDVYERLQRDDLMQAAVVMATFVWEAANRPDMLPRKPLTKADMEGSTPEQPRAGNRPGNP